jgi:hypothetical protein
MIDEPGEAPTLWGLGLKIGQRSQHARVELITFLRWATSRA